MTEDYPHIRLVRPVVPRGAGGALAPPNSGGSVKPIFQPRGADYAHQIILEPPDSQTFRQP